MKTASILIITWVVAASSAVALSTAPQVSGLNSPMTPEPATTILLGAGLIALSIARYRAAK